jgi:hypothetical protein
MTAHGRDLIVTEDPEAVKRYSRLIIRRQPTVTLSGTAAADRTRFTRILHREPVA